MAHDDVLKFLLHERDHFLKKGRVQARALRNAATDNWEKDMYRAWMEYYEELIAQSNQMLRMKSPELRQTLLYEVMALEALVEILDDISEGLGDKAKRLLQALRGVLEIERQSTIEMWSESH